ncbi:MAG: SIMPL domain-containing protein [Gammaproteobacteria bacterium]|jgi:hypothetical protein
MQREHTGGALVLGVFILLGLAALGYLLGDAAIRFKEFERSVTVKGLSEQEYPADVVIWPIQFTLADNELAALYATLEDNTARIRSFLQDAGIEATEISVSAPVITDKSAQNYGGGQQPEFRYSALQTVTVYSGDVQRVRGVMSRLVDLGKQGIALTGGNYQNQTEYLFTRLNDVKPAMIEEATTKAREVAEKFAQDSSSQLGKIRRASQGQFTISPRDRNNPHIMKVRVVSTVEYYLSD